MKYMSYRKMLEVYGKVTPFLIRLVITAGFGIFMGIQFGRENGMDPVLLSLALTGLMYSGADLYTLLSEKIGRPKTLGILTVGAVAYGVLVFLLLKAAPTGPVLTKAAAVLVCGVIPLVLLLLDLGACIWFLISLSHRKKTGGDPEEDRKVEAEFDAEQRRKRGLPDPEPAEEEAPAEEAAPEETLPAPPEETETAPKEADPAVTEESKPAAEETKEPAKETKATAEESKAAAEETKAGAAAPQPDAKEKKPASAGKISGMMGFSAAHYRAPDVTEEEMEASFEEARKD